MSNRTLNIVARILLGALGGVAALAATLVGATELKIAFTFWPYWPSVLAAAVCAAIAIAGLYLVRGVLRGRLALRTTRSA